MGQFLSEKRRNKEKVRDTMARGEKYGGMRKNLAEQTFQKGKGFEVEGMDIFQKVG